MTAREAIINTLRQATRLTSAQIAGATGLPKDQVQATLDRMAKAKLVRCERRTYWRLGR